MKIKDNHQFNSWFSKLGQAWEEKNPKAIPPLFADKFEYFETPFEKPFTTKEGLIKLWQDVPNSQKDIKFDFDIIMTFSDTAVAHWQATFTRIKQNKKASLDGIFLLKLNNKGLATLFRIWWITKE